MVICNNKRNYSSPYKRVENHIDIHDGQRHEPTVSLTECFYPTFCAAAYKMFDGSCKMKRLC